jgi:hypothetical protein
MIDKKAFDVNFDAAIETLSASEKTTKSVLRDLSRSVLEVLFFSEDIGYINRTINALSPMNKKLAIEYFKAFSGFNFIEDASSFGKKNKKQFEEIKTQALEFLSDPHNNIWTWADQQNFELVKKPFDINAISKYLSGAMKKAEKAGYSDADVLSQVFASGIDIDAIMQAMNKMSQENQVMVLDSEVVESDEESAPY